MYGETERLRRARDFQQLLDGVGAPGLRRLPPAPRRARSVSPTSRRGARTDDITAHSECLLNGSAVQVAAEIDVLRASQAARDAMASQRRIAAAAEGVFGLRSTLAASKAGVSPSPRSRLTQLPPLSMVSEEELFSEIGYLMQERDLALKEKKALQHLLSQASEEIRVLVAAEQRHVEELRSWVRQRDELLQHKAQGQQAAALAEGLKLRLDQTLTQHRHDKQAWEEEVRELLRAKQDADAVGNEVARENQMLKADAQSDRLAFSKMQHELMQSLKEKTLAEAWYESARKELDAVKFDLSNMNRNNWTSSHHELASIKAQLAQREVSMRACSSS